MPKSHIVIAGTGRSGTTLLMKLFTELGLETGYDQADYPTHVDQVSLGGLEVDFGETDFESLPKFVKSPYFYKFADQVLNDSKVIIEHVIIPIRMLDDAANSRIRIQAIHEDKFDKKLGGDLIRGGLTGTDSMFNQEIVLGRQLTSLLKSVSKSHTPFTILAFPSFARKPDYLYEAIEFLIPTITFEVFLSVFQEIVDTNQIHSSDDLRNDKYKTMNKDSILNDISHDQYLFRIDNYMPSAWIGHAPFMKFLMRELKPKVFVELGVHNGFSYFVGCQAIQECKISTKAYAIDHWQGDPQAGILDESVYQEVLRRNEIYSDFSTVIKSNFSDALTSFENKSVDLLHIDGFHSYESVREDFSTWLPKLSENGVVLFHDIHVRRKSFGVYKFWEEIKKDFKTIEFVGSHGLGVLFLNEVPDGGLHELFEISENGYLAQIQGTFGSISDDVIQNFRIRDNAISERDNAISERDNAISERDNAISERDAVLGSTTWILFGPWRRVVRVMRRVLIHSSRQ